MLTEISHILDTHEVTLVLRKLKETTRVVVLPKLLESDKEGDDVIAALQQPLVITGTPEELDAKLPETLLNYANVLKDGKDNLEAIEAEIKRAAEAKKKKAAPKKAAPKKGIRAPAKPKKPTKAEIKEKAREDQAKSGQGDLFEEKGQRLETSLEKVEKANPDEELDAMLEGI